MLAEQNLIFEDAVKTMYKMSAEGEIREQCRARKDYYRTINMYKAHIRNRNQKKDQLESENSEQAVKIDQLENELQRLKALLESSQKME